MEIETIGSYNLLLCQALSTKDVDIFRSIISSRNSETIVSTLKGLSSENLAAFFTMTGEELDKNPKYVPDLLVWLKKALICFADVAKAQPSIIEGVKAKLESLVIRAEATTRLLALRGRLRMLLDDDDGEEIKVSPIVLVDEDTDDKETNDIEKIFGKDEFGVEDEEEENEDDEDQEEEEENGEIEQDFEPDEVEKNSDDQDEVLFGDGSDDNEEADDDEEKPLFKTLPKKKPQGRGFRSKK